MARHLRALGNSVTLVASDAWGRLPDDEELGVLRVGDLRTAPPLRRLFGRGKLLVAGDTETLERPPTPLITRVPVPEMNVVTWLPALVVAMRRLLTQRTFDCLVTTSPPESSHLVGLALGKRRPAWLADFRDGWTFEPWREPFPTAAQRALDAWLERRVVQTAEVVVGATRPIAEDFEQRFGAGAVWVPNGWDPASEPPLEPSTEASSDGEAVTLVHTGTFSGLRGRDPEPLLRAMQIVAAEPRLPRLRLVLAGPLSTTDRDLIDRSGVAEQVEYRGMLEHPAALALQRAAGALLLMTSEGASVATAKIFEYVAAGRPIVALAEGDEAARIVRDTNTGVIVPPSDVDAIAAALRRVASGELARAYAPRNLERYTYPGPAEAMAELLEEAIRRRRID
jgi:glycosyltransferase involved in cell wall biosynthesis